MQQFVVPEINTLLIFESPIVTEKILLEIDGWVDDAHPSGSDYQFICQGVAIYGCLASEGTVAKCQLCRLYVIMSNCQND